MTGATGAALYTPEVLALAMSLADYPLREWHLLTGESTARICGSRVRIGLRMAPDGTIGDVGATVTACAIGQAAAAIFLAHAKGRARPEIEAASRSIGEWLAGGAQPDWPGLEVIAPARSLPARHDAIRLPWKAALGALSKGEVRG